MKDQSAQTTARNLSIAYGLWLPFLINRVLNLAKLRSVIFDQSVDSSCFALSIYMVISDPRHTEYQISQKQDERNLYAVMKTMCHPGYHHNGLVATHALGDMICIYIYIYIYIYDISYV